MPRSGRDQSAGEGDRNESSWISQIGSVSFVAVFAWLCLSQVQRDYVWRTVVGESVAYSLGVESVQTTALSASRDPMEHKLIEAWTPVTNLLIP